MKTLRQICSATILSLTLAVSVFAGQVDCPGTVSVETNPITTIILTIVTVVHS